MSRYSACCAHWGAQKQILQNERNLVNSDLNQISHCNIKGLSVREILTDWEHDHSSEILLIFQQILSTTSVRNVWRQERRICNLILELKGLRVPDDERLTSWLLVNVSKIQVKVWARIEHGFQLEFTRGFRQWKSEFSFLLVEVERSLSVFLLT